MITFRIGIARIHIRFSFLFLLSLFLLMEQLEQGGRFLLAVLWHELGHLLVLLLQKQQLTSVDLSAFGVRIDRQHSGSFWQEFLLHIAGPVANIIAVLFLLPWNKLSAIFHLVLATLNLLPILPMDGGHLSQLVLEQILSPTAAHRSSRILSVLTWTLLCLLGAWLLIRHWNPSMVIFTLLLALQTDT